MTKPYLSLRPLSGARDVINLLHMHITNNITRWWIGWETPQSLAETEASVTDALRRTEAGAYAGWLGYHCTDDTNAIEQFVGYVMLERLVEPMRGAWFELNFWVAEAHWGQGYSYALARGVLAWLIQQSDPDLRKVTMSWTHGNEASRRIIERLVGDQAPEMRLAIMNGIEVPVYHYVLDLDRLDLNLNIQPVCKMTANQAVSESELKALGTVPGDYLNPDWVTFDQESKHIHAWLNYISPDMRRIWDTFTPYQKAAIAVNAQDNADNENWE